MSLEHSDLDDLDFFPESSAHEMALARWEQRLGGMYDIVAAVAGDERHTRDIVAVTDLVDETGATGSDVPLYWHKRGGMSYYWHTRLCIGCLDWHRTLG
jgi:hypothetical protein